MTKPLKPTTTEQEDLVVAGQRRINFIWESTQSLISLLITSATIWAEINGIHSTILVAGFFLVVGNYFQRTNHSLIGGIGNKPYEKYKGR